MRTYQKLSLSLLILLLTGMVGSSQVRAFTPGYMNKSAAEIEFQCVNTDRLLPPPGWAITVDPWAPPAAPTQVEYTTDTITKAPNTVSPIDPGVVAGGSIWINNHPSMKQMREVRQDAAALERTGYTNYSQKGRLSSKLNSLKSQTSTTSRTIKKWMEKDASHEAYEEFTEKNTDAYSKYGDDLAKHTTAVNAQLARDYAAAWGSQSENSGAWRNYKSAIDAEKEDFEGVLQEARETQTRSCAAQRQENEKAEEDLAEIVADQNTAVGLEARKLTRATTEITESKAENIAAEKSALDDSVELVQQEAANEIIGIIEEKEGSKVEASNEARDQIVANTIDAEDAIQTVNDDADETIVALQTDARDAISTLQVDYQDQVQILRDDVRTAVQDVSSRFVDQRAAVQDRYQTQVSNIRSTWNAKIQSSRATVGEARRVLRKKPGANWNNGNRQQLLQSQRQASAQLAKAQKNIRWAEGKRAARLKGAEAQKNKSLAAIQKRQRALIDRSRAPMQTKIQQLTQSLSKEVRAIQAKLQADLAKVNTRRAADVKKIQDRLNAANSTLISDLAVVLASFERQKLQESKAVDTQSKLEVRKLDRAFKVEEAAITKNADRLLREATATHDDAVLVLNQEARSAIRTVKRAAATAQSELVRAEEDKLKELARTAAADKRAADAIDREYETKEGAAKVAWTQALQGSDGIYKKGEDRAGELYSQYKSAASNFSSAATRKSNSGKRAADTHYKRSNMKVISDVYRDARRDLSRAKKKKDRKD